MQPRLGICYPGFRKASRITLLNILLATDNRVIHLQLLHILMSNAFGNLTISPGFQSLGIASSYRNLYQDSNYDFSSSLQHISAITPGAFADFMKLIAFLTSSAGSGSMFITRSSSLTGISAKTIFAHTHAPLSTATQEILVTLQHITVIVPCIKRTRILFNF